MINAARTRKGRSAVLTLLASALLVVVLLLHLDEPAWVIGIALLLCLPFMWAVQLLMWAVSERGLPRPQGEPASAKDLIARLMDVNDESRPFEVTRDGNALTASWKLADDKWWGLFSREGFQAWYRLELLLDPKRKTVRAIELIKRRELHVDYDDASFDYERFRGWTLFHKQRERHYGFTEQFPLDFGKVSSLDLDTRAFRAPILDEITAAGWRVLPCTYSLRAGI